MEDSLSYLDNLLIVVIADAAEVYLECSLRGKDGKRRNLLAVSELFFKSEHTRLERSCFLYLL